MRPWLSVLMPVYNGGRYLAAALESVAQQDSGAVEVIAVDDGSNDDSKTILESFSDRLRLTIIQQAHAGNWVCATNRALAAATGEFIGFLHQDDVWLPGRLALLRRLATEHPQAEMLFHAAIFIDPAGKRLGEWRSPLRSGEYAPGSVFEPLLVQNFIAIPTPIVRYQAAERVGKLNEDLWYTADWDFWLKITSLNRCYYHDEPFAAFRLHAESQTALRSDQTKNFLQQMLSVYETHARSLGRNSSQTELDRVARFSIDMNTAMAQLTHGVKAPLGRLAWRFMRLGHVGRRRYLQDSRIIERAGSRLRLKLRGREDR